jgi:hypothetical protein
MPQSIDIEVFLGRRLCGVSSPCRSRSRVGRTSCSSSVQADARYRLQIPSPSRCLGVSDWTTTKAHRYRLCAASGSVSGASARLQCLLDQASLHGIRRGSRDRASSRFLAGVGDRPVPSRYIAGFTVFGRAAIGGGDDSDLGLFEFWQKTPLWK